MRDVGYWPYKNEDDMISKSFVNEKLYILARDTIESRYVEGHGDNEKEIGKGHE